MFTRPIGKTIKSAWKGSRRAFSEGFNAEHIKDKNMWTAGAKGVFNGLGFAGRSLDNAAGKGSMSSMGYGAALGGAYGAGSDDTSMIGGAVMGAGAGFAGLKAYSKYKK